ncbi:MAG: DUF1501 domain-containing protein [Verrucomicrobiota bacterium]
MCEHAEPLPENLTTRRAFLRSTVLGGALSWTVPTFIASTFDTLHAAAAAGGPVATGRDAPILVLMQLAGGNDGLNTVVPYANDDYHKARPNLRLKRDRLLPLNDELALPNYLKDFKALYDDGQLSIINGVGYPNPNRSHFRSTEIWHTASDAKRYEAHGWIGRYFDHACEGADPAVGVALSKQAPQAFTSAAPKGISLSHPEKFGFHPTGNKDQRAQQTMAYERLSHDDDHSGGTVMEVGGQPADPNQDPLDFLERTAMDAQMTSDQIKKIARTTKNEVPYPRNQLANQLALVSQLISGGMPTRIYYVSQGGYDTHHNQQNNHQRNVSQLGESVRAFLADLKAKGLDRQVMVMTFSEFGRRVKENGTRGTDHGAAAPLFLFGSRLTPGLLGRYPSLAKPDLDKGDLKYSTDFRSVYATVLQNWMGLAPAQTRTILKGSFPVLPLGVRA